MHFVPFQNMITASFTTSTDLAQSQIAYLGKNAKVWKTANCSPTVGECANCPAHQSLARYSGNLPHGPIDISESTTYHRVFFDSPWFCQPVHHSAVTFSHIQSLAPTSTSKCICSASSCKATWTSYATIIDPHGSLTT